MYEPLSDRKWVWHQNTNVSHFGGHFTAMAIEFSEELQLFGQF